ncbi:protein FAR1-related sequence 6, partial [Tanacetum coccineum]
SSEGSGITPEVPDEPKDNSAVVAEKQARYVQTNLTLSSAELEIQSMVDVPIHQEDLAVQRTPLIDPVISMVTEKTTSTPTPPTTQAHVQMHMVKILIENDVKELPSCYILSRWRKDVKHRYNFVKNCYDDLKSEEQAKQFDHLCAKFYEAANILDSLEKYEYVDEMLR